MGLLLFSSVFFTKRVIINGVLREKRGNKRLRRGEKKNIEVYFLAHQKMLRF